MKDDIVIPRRVPRSRSDTQFLPATAKSRARLSATGNSSSSSSYSASVGNLPNRTSSAANSAGSGSKNTGRSSNSGSGKTVGVISSFFVLLFLFFGGWWLSGLNDSNDSHDANNSQASQQADKIYGLEARLDELQQTSLATQYSGNAQGELTNQVKSITDNLVVLKQQVEGVAVIAGPRGATGATGAQGPAGSTGPQGPSGAANCDHGDCLSLQGSSPGVQEAGSINVSGDAIIGGVASAAVFFGSGSGLSALNAANITDGTLGDLHLSPNVALLNANQSFSGVSTFSHAGTGLVVTNGLQAGSINVTSNLAVAGTTNYGTKLEGRCDDLTGYVWVPGSAKYGTLPGFCVMQYEAKNDGSNNAVSTASGAPWVSIDQRSARLAAQAACSGCHLITENEWLTIADNVLWQNSNWSGGTVGTGCLFRGNSGISDTCSYNGADPESGTGRNSKARLSLSNGVELWDIAGNVYEWTDSIANTDDMPEDATIPDAGGEWLQYTDIIKYKAFNYARPTRDGWNSSQGIGNLFTDVGDASGSVRGLRRGGYWGIATNAGVFTLNLGFSQTSVSTDTGFRVAR